MQRGGAARGDASCTGYRSLSTSQTHIQCVDYGRCTFAERLSVLRALGLAQPIAVRGDGFVHARVPEWDRLGQASGVLVLRGDEGCVFEFVKLGLVGSGVLGCVGFVVVVVA